MGLFRIGGVALLAVLAAAAPGCTSEEGGVGEQRPDATRLFLAGSGEVWVVDTEAETARRVVTRPAGGGDAPYDIREWGGRLVLWGPRQIFGAESDRLGPTLGPITRGSSIFIPGSSPDTVWVGYLSDEATAHDAKLGELREMTLDGSVVRRIAAPPRGAWPHSGMNGGLLYWGRGDVYLWDPHKRRVVRSYPASELGGLGPVSGDLVASCRVDPCEDLRVTSFEDGSHRIYHPSRGQFFDVYTASFSPDERTLAVAANATGGVPSRPAHLTLIDLGDGDVHEVPNSRLPGGYRYVTWSQDGREVFMTGGESGEHRLIERYELGSDAAEPIDVRVGEFYDVAAE